MDRAHEQRRGDHRLRRALPRLHRHPQDLRHQPHLGLLDTADRRRRSGYRHVGHGDRLTNETAYQIQIQATNSVGDSPWSASATGTPTPQKPDAPDAPTLTVKNESLDVSWTAPADNGATITDYNVQYRACTATDGDTAVLTCATNPTWGSWNSHTHTGIGTTSTIGSLTNETAYQVQVQATNSVGNSPWSASATGTPPPRNPTRPTRRP